MNDPGSPTVNRDEIWTLAETCAFCRVSRTTLYRWRNEQGLKVIHVLGIARVRRRDLEAFLERHEK